MKHKEIAKAWLEGAVVQCRFSGDSSWNTLKTVDDAICFPVFQDDLEYRIKPKEKVKKYKFLVRDLCTKEFAISRKFYVSKKSAQNNFYNREVLWEIPESMIEVEE